MRIAEFKMTLDAHLENYAGNRTCMLIVCCQNMTQYDKILGMMKSFELRSDR